MLRLIAAAVILAAGTYAAPAAPVQDQDVATVHQRCIGACGVARARCSRTKFTKKRGCGIAFDQCRTRCNTSPVR
jgi:hypothetical protein